jgi:hypothetical protein
MNPLAFNHGAPLATMPAPIEVSPVVGEDCPPRRWSETDAINRRWNRLAAIAILLGVLIRVIWVFAIHPPGSFVYSDMQGYVDRAMGLAEGMTLERFDAWWPPGTHILLAVPFKIFGTGQVGLWAGSVTWCILSSLVPFFAWRLALLFFSPATAGLAAVFCAFWPLYITYAGFFTSETPSLAMLLAALWLGYRARRASGTRRLAQGFLAGVCGGVAMAIRPQWILNLAILILPALVRWRQQLIAVVGLAFGAGLVLTGIIVHNSVAAGALTGLSENNALVFWMGHCDIHDVQFVEADQGWAFTFGPPVPTQLERGYSYVFNDRLPWDQPFFFDLGLQCIREDGFGHVRLLARSILDMTATTIPWPQVSDVAWQRELVHVSNLGYSILLPWIVIESLFLIRRHPINERSGVIVMLGHLSCVAIVAVLGGLSEPRYRSTYDVFGLVLLAAILVDRFSLDQPERDSQIGDSVEDSSTAVPQREANLEHWD